PADDVPAFRIVHRRGGEGRVLADFGGISAEAADVIAALLQRRLDEILCCRFLVAQRPQGHKFLQEPNLIVEKPVDGGEDSVVWGCHGKPCREKETVRGNVAAAPPIASRASRKRPSPLRLSPSPRYPLLPSSGTAAERSREYRPAAWRGRRRRAPAGQRRPAGRSSGPGRRRRGRL